MTDYHLARTEALFADLIWENEPISSGDLVRLCEKELNWKPTTTYTVLRRLCEKEIFQNQNRIVSSRISREEFYGHQGRQLVDGAFAGSLPKFLAAFIGNGKLNRKQAEEIRRMIDEYQEEEGED